LVSDEAEPSVHTASYRRGTAFSWREMLYYATM
jgi:hypothetical protein